MNFNLKEIFAATMILFAVIDIMGSIPLIISLRKKVGHIQSEKATLGIGSDHDRIPLFGGKTSLNTWG